MGICGLIADIIFVLWPGSGGMKSYYKHLQALSLTFGPEQSLGAFSVLDLTLNSLAQWEILSYGTSKAIKAHVFPPRRIVVVILESMSKIITLTPIIFQIKKISR
jgi:hypothetical protein